MAIRPLEGVVIAFDIDNTLVDPTGDAYTRTVRDFLTQSKLGLDPSQAGKTFEELRAHGRVLERMGLGNTIHERNHPDGMALLCLMACDHAALLDQLDIHREDRPAHDIVLRKLHELDGATRHGSPDARLQAEVTLRHALSDRPEIHRLRDEIRRVAETATARELSRLYRSIELNQPMRDCRGLIEPLIGRGATPVVISEGRFTIQHEKLERAGIAGLLEGRVLVTDLAANVSGLDELDRTIEELINDEVSRNVCDTCGPREGGGEDSSVGDAEAASPLTKGGLRGATCDTESGEALATLWQFRCLIEEWSSKTPWFYARCLHAIQHARLQEADGIDLSSVSVVPAADWSANPLWFVMVGDRHDKDVQPLRDLLGASAGKTIRLHTGKYAHLAPPGDLSDDAHAEHTFTDWDAMAGFLTSDLRRDDVQPIATPPAIVPRDDTTRQLVEQGQGSSFESVRAVASAVTRLL